MPEDDLRHRTVQPEASQSENTIVRLLLVEDEPAHVDAIRRALKSGHMKHSQIRFDTRKAGSLGEYKQAVSEYTPDLVIMDLVLPDGRAESILAPPPALGSFPIVVMTSHGNESTAVAAMKAGALDYIVKSPESFMAMPHIIERVLREWNGLKERNRAMEALKENEAIAKARADELAALMDAVPAIIFIAHDPACERLTSSRAGLRALRIPDEGAAPLQLPIDERPKLHRTMMNGRLACAEELPLRVAAATGRPVRNAEVTLAFGDGSSRDLFGDAVPLFDSRGNVRGSLGAFLDVTELKLADQALVETARRLRTTINNLPGMVYRCANDRQWTMEYISERVLDITGYAADDLIASRVCSYGSLIDPDDRARICAVVQSALAARNSFTFEYRIRAADGTVKAVWERGQGVFDDQGGLLFLEGYIEDITARKRIEEQRQAFQRQMEQTQRLESLGVLAGGIAHDFNNLLMGIMGYADLALYKLPPSSPARDCLSEIEKAAHRAAELCRQMLAYSGKGKYVIEKIGLRDLVVEMAHLLKTTISKKTVLKLDVEAPLPQIEGDASQIRQIVMNLITNASESLNEHGGIIRVSTGVMQCARDELADTYLNDGLDPGTYIYIEVADTGCGMTAETIGRMFEPFFTTKFTGRGLGMAAVLGIVRAHKGAIKITSELDSGTTIRVLFPAMTGAFESVVEDCSPPPGCDAFEASGCVLLADDDETVRILGSELFERLGFEVIATPDGQQAVRLFQERQKEIALVVLDLTMPRMDGEETFRALRRIDPHVRVVISSGYTEQVIDSRFEGQGLSGFLQKPYRIADIQRLMRRLFGEAASRG